MQLVVFSSLTANPVRAEKYFPLIMDVDQVISVLDAEDSNSVRSFSSECFDLLEPLEEQEEPEVEELPMSKVFASRAKSHVVRVLWLQSFCPGKFTQFLFLT